jgi:transcriptional regulator with XRE-family HTH domain
MKSLGQRIREERRKLNLTLDQVSQSTGLSKSFLSQIERTTAEPSISTIKKIARVFGISVYQLFMDETENSNFLGHLPSKETEADKKKDFVKDIKIVKANQRKRFILPSSNISHELITPDLNRQIEMLYIRLSPGDNTGREPVIDAIGEKCFLVLKGALEFRIKDNLYQLNMGDSIYFPADFPYSYRGIGNEFIEALCVLTPPWF